MPEPIGECIHTGSESQPRNICVVKEMGPFLDLKGCTKWCQAGKRVSVFDMWLNKGSRRQAQGPAPREKTRLCQLETALSRKSLNFLLPLKYVYPETAGSCALKHREGCVCLMRMGLRMSRTTTSLLDCEVLSAMATKELNKR